MTGLYSPNSILQVARGRVAWELRSATREAPSHSANRPTTNGALLSRGPSWRREIHNRHTFNWHMLWGNLKLARGQSLDGTADRRGALPHTVPLAELPPSKNAVKSLREELDTLNGLRAAVHEEATEILAIPDGEQLKLELW